MNTRKFNEVESEFLNRGTIRGGTLLMKARDAIECIQRCKELHYKILGVDGFFLTNDTTQPSLEDTLDFDWPQYSGKVKDRFLEAIHFIEARAAKDMYFEIVCDPIQ